MTKITTFEFTNLDYTLKQFLLLTTIKFKFL